jgi:Domain of unknown function (DUF6894)
VPRYFFHVHDGDSIRDADGTELPDIYAAQAEAVKLSGALLRDLGGQFWNGQNWKLEVTGDRGQALFVLTFSAKELVSMADDPPDTASP